MNIRLLPLLLISLLLSCTSSPGNRESENPLDQAAEGTAHQAGETAPYQTMKAGSMVYEAGDMDLLEQVLERFSGDTDAPISGLMIGVGRFFLETPYVAHTLETGDGEQLIINLRELDCTTFAENCLALSRTIKSGKHDFAQFVSELQNIRYRDGKIDGYPSRLHYFCDWIYANGQKKLIDNQPPDLPQSAFRKEINFMSTHPGSYRQLEEDSTLVGVLAEQERLISARDMFFIPENSLAEVEDLLMDGDIAGITTGIDGIAIQHVVLLVRVQGRIHMLHASSKEEKVVLSENTLEEYLLASNSATGIMLARPIW